jgi:hypothetical protein
VGGTRLRAVLAESSDGSAIFLHWWDTQLGETCQFEEVDEPEVSARCLPRTAWTIYEGIEEVFADARCSQPLLRDGTPPSGLVRRIDTRCWDTRDYFRVGARFAGPSAYRKSDAGCVEQPSGSAVLHVLTPLPWTAFVAARSMAGATSGELALAQLLAEDGSRAPSGFFDQVAGIACWPRTTSQGMRCLPTSFGWADRGGMYADARCSQLAAVAEPGCGGRRSALPFVLFEERSASGVVSAVHRGGGRLPQVFERVGADECAAGPSDSVAFAVGQALPLDDFKPASLLSVPLPSGLIQMRAQVRSSAADTADALTVARFDQLASSALGGYECVLAVTPDGVVRCVPRVQIIGEQYADARCTQPIWQTWSALISLQTDAATVQIAAGKAGRIDLPRVDRVLTGGVPHEAAVYARQGAECSVVPGVPNTRQAYRRFSGEANLGDLPALPIVVR